MTVEISSYAVPCNDGTDARMIAWFARQYEDVIDERGRLREETCRDWNHAVEIVGRICHDDSAISMDAPPEGAVRIMSVYLNVLKTRRGVSQYRAAYRRHEFGAMYNEAADATMDVYRAVKRVLRGAQREVAK